MADEDQTMIATLLLLAALATPQQHISVSTQLDPAAGPAGSELTATLTAQIESGWHIYHRDERTGIVAKVTLEGDGFELVQDFRTSKEPKVYKELIGGTPLVQMWLAGEVPYVGKLRVAETDSDGVAHGELVFLTQVCNDRVCLPPSTDRFPISFKVEGAPAGAAPADSGAADAAPAAGAAHGPSVKVVGKHAQGSLYFERATAAVGDQVNLIIDLQVEENWHLYAPEQDDAVIGEEVALKVLGELDKAGGALRSLTEPLLHTDDLGFGPLEFQYLEGHVRLSIPVVIGDQVGSRKVPVELFWQPCDPSICDENEVFPLEIPLQVTASKGGAVAGAASQDTTGDGAPGSDPNGDAGISVSDLINRTAQSALDQGFWALMLAAMAAGFATLLTPCVFPMIPITVSFFTKRAEAGKGSPLGNASAYTIGIVLTFVGLGLGAAAILGASGANQIASYVWMNLGIAVLFLVLAFSLLGFFEIQPPKFLQRFASEAQAGGTKKGGYWPVVLMGFAFSVTAFTCTVGFVGSVLALAATGGEWWYSLAAMTVYALVFSLPFFFLAMFPNAMRKMPTAGGWMNAVKVSFGYIEIIAAWKFLSSAERVQDMQILTRPVVIAMTIVPLLLWAAYMFGLYKTKGDYGQKPARTWARSLVGLLVLASAGYLATGFTGRHYDGWVEAYFPPVDYGQPNGPLGLNWHDDVEAALAAGRTNNSPVFLDFTGVTCVNCLRMEGNIFVVDEVAEKIKKLTRGHLYVDKEPHGKVNREYQLETFDISSQPYYAVVDPRSGKPLAVFDGYDPDPESFAAFLQEGIDKGAALGLDGAQ